MCSLNSGMIYVLNAIIFIDFSVFIKCTAVVGVKSKVLNIEEIIKNLANGI